MMMRRRKRRSHSRLSLLNRRALSMVESTSMTPRQSMSSLSTLLKLRPRMMVLSSQLPQVKMAKLQLPAQTKLLPQMRERSRLSTRRSR